MIFKKTFFALLLVLTLGFLTCQKQTLPTDFAIKNITFSEELSDPKKMKIAIVESVDERGQKKFQIGYTDDCDLRSLKSSDLVIELENKNATYTLKDLLFSKLVQILEIEVKYLNKIKIEGIEVIPVSHLSKISISQSEEFKNNIARYEKDLEELKLSLDQETDPKAKAEIEGKIQKKLYHKTLDERKLQHHEKILADLKPFIDQF